MIKAEAIKTQDVRGKELFYIKCSNGEHNYFINVGKKTHDEVKHLENVQHIGGLQDGEQQDNTSQVVEPVSNNKTNKSNK